MMRPNPVEFELPYNEGLLLQLRGEWIAERKVEGIRTLLDHGILKTPSTDIRRPGPIAADWKNHVFDGCLVGEVYYIFDILALDNEDTRRRPLYERRTLLRSLRLPEWCCLIPCGKNIGEFLEAVVQDGGTGIVLKNLLEGYGNAQWIKVERPKTQDVVIMEIHEATGSVTVGQFRGNELVECGLVFMGSLLGDAQVGGVMEVVVEGRTAEGELRCARFARFHPHKSAAQCVQAD